MEDKMKVEMVIMNDGTKPNRNGRYYSESIFKDITIDGKSIELSDDEYSKAKELLKGLPKTDPEFTYIQNYTDIIKIDRKCNPNGITTNGYKYDIESYNKALEHYLSTFNDYSLRRSEVHFGDYNIYNRFDSMYRYSIIDPKLSSSNKILNITDDYIEYEMETGMIEKIKDAISDGYEPKVLMRSIGTLSEENEDDIKTYKIDKIIGFDIHVADHKNERNWNNEHRESVEEN